MWAGLPAKTPERCDDGALCRQVPPTITQASVELCFGAVKASALRADRAGAYARLRALTAPARSSGFALT